MNSYDFFIHEFMFHEFIYEFGCTKVPDEAARSGSFSPFATVESYKFLAAKVSISPGERTSRPRLGVAGTVSDIGNHRDRDRDATVAQCSEPSQARQRSLANPTFKFESKGGWNLPVDSESNLTRKAGLEPCLGSHDSGYPPAIELEPSCAPRCYSSLLVSSTRLSGVTQSE